MATLLPASLCSDSVFLPPPWGSSNSTIVLTHTLLPSSSTISGGERQRIRQLFCLEDSILPFSGISSSIIILIIAFDPKNYQTCLKVMAISLSATNSWAFKNSDFTVKHWIMLQCLRRKNERTNETNSILLRWLNVLYSCTKTSYLFQRNTHIHIFPKS